MFKQKTRVEEFLGKGLLWNYNNKWHEMSWYGVDAVHGFFRHAGKNKEILRYAFEQGYDGNGLYHSGEFIDLPKFAQHLVMDQWLVLDNDPTTYDLYSEYGFDFDQKYQWNLSIHQIVGHMTLQAEIITLMLERAPDADKVLNHKSKLGG